MKDAALTLADMTEAAARVRAGATSFEDLTLACLAQAEATADLNAYETLLPQEALAAARAQDQLLRAGYDLGPLQGMPIALKSNIALKGAPYTAGSRILADRSAARDAEVVRRLKSAGAVILGLTNMHEFAWGGTTANPHYGQTRNARDPARIPAGSSGGSGAVVAAGSAMAALGTDTGGSVRLPAAMNGIFGLRPGIGQVPVEGIFPLAFSLDTVGPMTRSARDALMLYDAMAGGAGILGGAGMLGGAGIYGGAGAAGSGHRPRRPRRLGLPRAYVYARLETAVERAFTAWLDARRAEGIEVVDLDLPDMDLAVDALVIPDAAEPTALHDAWLDARPEDYGADVRAQLLAGRSILATEYLHAQRFRAAFRRRVLAALGEVDLIVMPTLPFVAPLIGQQEVILSGHAESTLTANMRFTALASCAGLPALSLPALSLPALSCSTDPAGNDLPVGVQLIGADGAEREILAFAASLA